MPNRNFPPGIQRQALQRQSYRCASCGTPIAAIGQAGSDRHRFGEGAHAHHVIPHKMGGSRRAIASSSAALVTTARTKAAAGAIPRSTPISTISRWIRRLRRSRCSIRTTAANMVRGPGRKLQGRPDTARWARLPAILQRLPNRRLSMQRRRIEQWHRAVLVAYEQHDLRAAEDDRFGAPIDQPRHDVPVRGL